MEVYVLKTESHWLPQPQWPQQNIHLQLKNNPNAKEDFLIKPDFDKTFKEIIFFPSGIQSNITTVIIWFKSNSAVTSASKTL